MASGFIWSENLTQIIVTALLSMVPTFEGRYAVVTALAMGMPAVFSFLLALIFSTIPMPFIFMLLKPVLKWLYSLPIEPLRKFAAWVENRSVKKSASVKKKGLLGLFLFVAVPLPGTGVWTGSAIATILNMNKTDSMLAIVVGNVVACLAMTILGSMGITLFS
ncbi:MAG: small multi-drug export protein [Clostridia bacterium]|nr:small multi-drug export protein [Clostridia bacterium]